jgi:hypothetical protein
VYTAEASLTLCTASRYPRPFLGLVDDGARRMIEGITERSRTWMVGELVPPFRRGINLQIQVSNVEALLHNFMEADSAATNPQRGSGHPVARAL